MIQALNFRPFYNHSARRSYLIITCWGFTATALFWAVLAGSAGRGRGIQLMKAWPCIREWQRRTCLDTIIIILIFIFFILMAAFGRLKVVENMQT